MNSDETIVAVSSAVGPAARMIVRTSGPAAIDVMHTLTPLASTASGSRAFKSFLRFSELDCPAWVYQFQSPASYTGEDLVEYHLPGNPVLVDMLLRHLRHEHGDCLRAAEPGEFTARAYFNGRLDLTQAEGVAAVVAAQSQDQAEAGRRLMAGELSRRLQEPNELVVATLALLEVGIDFSDEDVTFLPTDELLNRVSRCRDILRALLRDSARFKPLGFEPAFVLVGRPNVGKSTLLNALAGYERAVASAVSGTTRDALTAHVLLARGSVRVIDVAGLEPADQLSRPSSVDGIAAQMFRRATSEIGRADFVIALTAADDPKLPPALSVAPDLLVITKQDLAGEVARATHSIDSAIRLSAATGAGLGVLRHAMDDLAFGRTDRGSFAMNARHESAVAAAIEALDRTKLLATAEGPVELIAAELREVLMHTGAVLGRITPDDLLGHVFAQFCIGK